MKPAPTYTVFFFLLEEAHALKDLGCKDLFIKRFQVISITHLDKLVEFNAVCSQVTWNCFSFAVLCFLKCSTCLALALLQSLMEKNWSPVQVAIIPSGPTNSQECCSYIPLLSFLLSLFFSRNYCVSLYITYSSLFTVQSVKMSNKNKYQCYSSQNIQ